MPESTSSDHAQRGEQRTRVQPHPSIRDLRNWRRDDWTHWVKSLSLLITGLFGFSVALVMALNSGLGANSWTVLQDGITKQTPISLGVATQLVGVIMLVVSWFAGIRPGIGTLLNLILIGLFIDLLLLSGVIPEVSTIPAGIVMILGAVLIMGLSSGLYIKPGLGAGPRDSFMLALTEITGIPIGIARWMMETSAVVVGILLGGSFGVGTIIFAMLIGPSVSFGFRLFRLPTRRTRPGGERTVVGQRGQRRGRLSAVVASARQEQESRAGGE